MFTEKMRISQQELYQQFKTVNKRAMNFTRAMIKRVGLQNERMMEIFNTIAEKEDMKKSVFEIIADVFKGKGMGVKVEEAAKDAAQKAYDRSTSLEHDIRKKLYGMEEIERKKEEQQAEAAQQMSNILSQLQQRAEEEEEE